LLLVVIIICHIAIAWDMLKIDPVRLSVCLSVCARYGRFFT